MTADRYAALRAALDAGPLPGRRYRGRSPHSYCVYDKECWHAPDGSRHGETPNLVIVISPEDAGADAALIAACDPETIAALLRERDALRDAVQWYANMSKRMGDACIAQDNQAVLALMKEVAIDYGGRARVALTAQERP